MLGKLLKYEIKATARIFLPFYAVLLVSAAVHKLISDLSLSEWQAPEVISMMIYVIILSGMFVMTLIVMVQRFYKNLLSDEGYLMLTLPVHVWEHIISKLLVSMMWTTLSGIMAILSIFIIAYYRTLAAEFIQFFKNSIQSLYNSLGISIVHYLVAIVLLYIISLAATNVLIYASIAIGHLLNRHRILASLGAFIALSTVSQVLFAVVGFIPATKYFINIDIYYNTPYNLQTVERIFSFGMWYSIAFFGLMTAGYFLITNYILSRHLNLE